MLKEETLKPSYDNLAESSIFIIKKHTKKDPYGPGYTNSTTINTKNSTQLGLEKM